MSSTEQRIAAFTALVEIYGESIDGYDEGEEEDPREYIDGHRPIGKFCTVTINYSSRGFTRHFLPTFDTLREAQQRAVEYVTDDLFEEIPDAVVDLDSGETYEPRWISLQWKKAS